MGYGPTFLASANPIIVGVPVRIDEAEPAEPSAALISPDAVPTTTLTLDMLPALPSTANGRLSVVVTDGLNVSEAQVVGLSVTPNRLPRVAITSPVDGYDSMAGSIVPLAGYALDPEDGLLGTAALDWYSDLDGWLGGGRALNLTTLSVGTHVVTLRATDSASGQAYAQITVVID